MRPGKLIMSAKMETEQVLLTAKQNVLVATSSMVIVRAGGFFTF
jgi:hypothetical protein